MNPTSKVKPGDPDYVIGRESALAFAIGFFAQLCFTLFAPLGDIERTSMDFLSGPISNIPEIILLITISIAYATCVKFCKKNENQKYAFADSTPKAAKIAIKYMFAFVFLNAGWLFSIFMKIATKHYIS